MELIIVADYQVHKVETQGWRYANESWRDERRTDEDARHTEIAVSIAAADVNGDGEMDLICANVGGYSNSVFISGNTLSVFTNNGSGIWRIGFVIA